MKGTTVPSEEEKGCWGRFKEGAVNVWQMVKNRVECIFCCSQGLKQSDNQVPFEDVEMDQMMDDQGMI